MMALGVAFMKSEPQVARKTMCSVLNQKSSARQAHCTRFARAKASAGSFSGAQFPDNIQVSAQVYVLGKFQAMRGDPLSPQFKPRVVIPDHLCDRGTQFFRDCIKNSTPVFRDDFLCGSKLARDYGCSCGEDSAVLWQKVW